MAHARKSDLEQARDIPPTGVRLPPDLREDLKRAAVANGRSLSQEITQRLRSTFAEPGRAVVVDTLDGPPTVQFKALTGSQRALLMHFGLLPPEKQLALLTLLKR